MVQGTRIQRVTTIAIAVFALSALSVFAEQRLDWRTNGPGDGGGSSTQSRWDVEGVVDWVNPNGDEFTLRTNRGVLRIDAKGGIVAWYRGRRYRIRDLERGDRVGVDLSGSRSSRLHARSVTVLESVRDRAYGQYDPYGPNDTYGRGYDQHGSRVTAYVEGTIVSIQRNRDLVVLHSDRVGDITIDTRALGRSDGNRWARGLHRGSYAAFSGWYSGRNFVADSLQRSGDGWRDGRGGQSDHDRDDGDRRDRDD
ncbi:MAG: hypothetical protein WBX15_03605 [Thermoanaerobaculia bacterium]